jgi:myxalamid-type polyketide synthase MxaB
MSIDWSKFLSQLPAEAKSPWLENFDSETGAESKPEPEFLQQLTTVPMSERWDLLREHVKSQLAKVLGLNSGAQIDLQEGFADLGMDSLMAVELRNRLQDNLGCSIPSTLAFDYPTVEALVNYLAQLLSLEPTDRIAKESSTLVQLEPEIKVDDLSEAEIADLLAQELNDIQQELIAIREEEV